jgi:hypothetical protein
VGIDDARGDALPEAVTLSQYFKNNGYYCAALNKIYHKGIEDGPSWSEPHWYPNGQTIDTDPADWSKRIIKKAGSKVKYMVGTMIEIPRAALLANEIAEVAEFF